jgi:hypothetical protein
MSRWAAWTGFAALLALLGVPCARADLSQAAAEAIRVLESAEERFQPPRDEWFQETQTALRAEVERVGAALDAHNVIDAEYWKNHLRWELLERNLGPRDTVNLSELELVRRWMYSNRAGLEGQFFAPLRAAMDAHLDAAFTLSYDDLRGEFERRVQLARDQCQALAYEPTDDNAAALGQTLGWFERTGQLPGETAAIHHLLSKPNAQAFVDVSLIRRIMATQETGISETVPLVERVEATRTNPLQRRRTITVRGDATTSGTVRLEPVVNNERAEFSLIYDGDIYTDARGETGPVTLKLRVTGTCQAVKSVYFGPGGLELAESAVTPQVRSRLTGVEAPNEVLDLIARRRVGHPDSQAQMNSQARATATEQVQLKFDERVKEAIDKLISDIQRMRAKLSAFQEVTAPLAREGAEPTFTGAQTTDRDMRLNAYARHRGQFGAATPCPADAVKGDVVIGVHASFFNNLAETITGGKTLSDEFLMKYAKVVHAELPLPLMVHSRAPRWAFTMARHRPLSVTIPDQENISFRVRVDAVEIDGATTEVGATAMIRYRLERDKFGDFALLRKGGVEFDAHGPADVQAFVHEKLDAFFGPVLNGGGVIVPEGGAMGTIRSLEWQGLQAKGDWIVTGWKVPDVAIDALVRFQEEVAATAPVKR